MTDAERLIEGIVDRMIEDPELRQYSDDTLSVITLKVMRFTLEALADVQRQTTLEALADVQRRT